jgi:hypothetical protein
VPGKLEFARAVRQIILEERPKVVAVELPATLENAYLQAIKRLPQMSVILYGDEGDEEQAIYLPVEPADPFVEAVRTAREVYAKVVFLDPDANERPHIPDHYPDTYALNTITREQYVEAYRLHPQARSEDVERHADGIAWKWWRSICSIRSWMRWSARRPSPSRGGAAACRC